MADSDEHPAHPPVAPQAEGPPLPGTRGADDLGMRVQWQFERMLWRSRLLIMIPVVFLLIDALGSFLYGCVIFVKTVIDLVHNSSNFLGTTGRFLVVMDTYLVGATLLISALGFYLLFIGGDTTHNTLYLPSWLRMHDLEDLKARVVSMLILVAAITFVDTAVETHDETGVFWLGIGIAVVIIALTAFLRFGRQAHASAKDSPGSQAESQQPELPD